jgi:soluble cytochrome b562
VRKTDCGNHEAERVHGPKSAYPGASKAESFHGGGAVMNDYKHYMDQLFVEIDPTDRFGKGAVRVCFQQQAEKTGDRP